VARVDVKADRKRGTLKVLSAHYEAGGTASARDDRRATRSAVDRYAAAVELRPLW
jgi:uncharacterized protein YcaQ